MVRCVLSFFGVRNMVEIKSSLSNGRGSWVVGTSRGSWVWVWVWVWVMIKN